MSGDKFERGSRVRREVLGADHIDAAADRTNEFDASFQTFATLGRAGELEIHLRGSRNIGVDPQEVAEALLHVAVYAGVPAANAAVEAAKRILGETHEP